MSPPLRYPLAAPDLSGNERAYVLECLETGWISSRGRFVPAFEEAVARLVGRRHAVATCNGTTALHLALLGLGVGPGDEVIVPSLTFVATANAVTYCGARPVFADVDPSTRCLSVESARRLLTARTRGLIGVDLYGHPCDVTGLEALAAERGLWLLEDAAEALGAEGAGRRVGSFGVASVLSFFGNKTVTTGEGGMVLTDDDDLAARLRLTRGQGQAPDRVYWFPTLGYNYRLTNVAAAIGLAQTERADRLVADRRRVAGWYASRLADADVVDLPGQAPGARSVYWLYSVLVRGGAARRDALARGLLAAGIETRPLFTPLHELPMYREHPTDGGCPVSRDLAARGLSLPTSSYLREEDVDEICGELTRLARS